jgi:phosphoserine phosphatase
MPDSGTISANQMKMVLDVSRMLAVTTDLDPLLRRIAEAATALLGAERASIFLHDPETHELWTKVALQSKEIRVPDSRGIVGSTFKKNEIQHVPNPYEDPRFNPEPDRKSGFVTRNLLCAPMVDLDRTPIGVIQAINKTSGGFTESDRAMIQMLADQAGVAIQRYRLQLATLEIVALRKEMDLAKKVQEALIPKEPPDVEGIDAVGWTRAASVTGGDCFDLWRTSDGRLGIFLGDASGHGLAPALVVSQVRTLVRTISEIEPDPHALLSRVNSRLAEDLEWGRFVTAFLGFLSPDGVLTWTSAGHGPLFMRESPEVELAVLDPPVQPLGVLDAWLGDAPTPRQIKTGGSLIFTSDGIFEAMNADGDQYGIDRMTALLDKHRDDSPDNIIAVLCQAVHDWQGNDDPHDDQTIVVVRRI